MTKLAVAIATEMGLKGDQIHEITVAASLHDIGKVTVPVEILSKPGKISAIEMDIIRTHSEAGHNIVKDIEFPWPIAEIVYQHHERMDGSGYPRHLKGFRSPDGFSNHNRRRRSSKPWYHTALIVPD